MIMRIISLIEIISFITSMSAKSSLAFMVSQQMKSIPTSTQKANKQTMNGTKFLLHVSSFSELEQEQSKAQRNILFEKLDHLYTQSSIQIKCPFFRRRAADMIDSIAMVTRFLLIRHKSLIGLVDHILPIVDDTVDLINTDDSAFLDSMIPPGCRAFKQGGTFHSAKSKHLDDHEIASIIYNDWTRKSTKLRSKITASSNVKSMIHHSEQSNHEHHKGYYITGILNTTIYRDDCFFDGPDPDMPVRGLRKYLSAASKLFDHHESYADLLDLKVLSKTTSAANYFDTKFKDGITTSNVIKSKRRSPSSERKIEVKWRIGGVIMLPWKPKIKPYTGRTIYHIDENGLIYYHEEKWDISVWEAFIQALFPEMGKRIWVDEN